MATLIIGLLLFLGIHSVHIFAAPWREQRIAKMGDGAWKGMYTVIAIVGLGLIVWGYGLSRYTPVDIWNPPVAMKHIASLLTLIAFVLLAATYIPRNRIKRAVGHPMLLFIKFWAFAHLLANGRLADLLLFGGFLVWAALSFSANRKKDRAAAYKRPADVSVLSDLATVVIGVAAWAGFAFYAHAIVTGVAPFG